MRVPSAIEKHIDVVCERLEKYEYLQAGEAPWYQVYLPYIIFALLLGGLWFFIMRQGGGGKLNSFAKSKAKLSSDEQYSSALSALYSDAVEQFPDFDIKYKEADIKVHYVQPTVKVKINENGKIESIKFFYCLNE